MTNKSFELTAAQLEIYNTWISAMVSQAREAGEDPFIIDEVKIVFHFTSIGREIVAKIPGSSAQVILEDLA